MVSTSVRVFCSRASSRPLLRKYLLHLPQTALALGLCFTAPFVSIASESVSQTFVATASTIKGTDSGYPYTFLALQSIRPVVASGVVTAVSGVTISDSSAGWQNDQFNGASGPYYLELESGLMADIVDTEATGGVLTLVGDISASVQVTDTYRIRRHTTISDLFGADNSANLKEGNGPDDADNIIIYGGGVYSSATYWRWNQSGSEGWYNFSYVPAGDAVIYPEQGFYIKRKDPGGLTLTTSGVQRDGSYVAPIVQGYNLVGSIRDSETSIAAIGLVTGDPITGFASGENPDDGDNVLIIGGSGGAVTLWHSALSGFEGWRDFNYELSEDFVISPGTAFFIRRKSPGFDWSIPIE